jgi:hypothetical protein
MPHYSQMKKMCYLYTMEFNSGTKKNEILLFAGKCIELENIILVKLARFRKPNGTCSPSYVEYRPKTNAAML